MKKVALFIAFMAFCINTFAGTGDPIVIEAVTKHTTIEKALEAAKDVLLTKKFITQQIQSTRFTATRTTDSRADYYTADVSATQADGKVTVKITFVKSGTGLMNLKKLAAAVKEKLEE
jgi:hypothetical protein